MLNVGLKRKNPDSELKTETGIVNRNPDSELKSETGIDLLMHEGEIPPDSARNAFGVLWQVLWVV